MAQIARRVRQAGVYFATTDTWERHALFINALLANIVVEQIAACRDRGFYKLHAFVLMPDHLHVLITPAETTTIHRMRIDRPQPFPIWHRGFHDRWIRDVDQFWKAKSYIEQNPVKARLAKSAESYPWSSSAGQIALDPSRYDEARG